MRIVAGWICATLVLAALPLHSALSQPDTSPEAVLKVARAAERAGDWSTAEELLEECASEPAGPNAGLIYGECLRELMICRMHLAELDGAMEAGTAASRFYADLGEHALAAQVMSTLGGLLRAAGQNERAADAYNSALDSFSHADDQASMASIHMSLGILAELDGEMAAALTHFDDALQLFRRVGDEESVAQSYRNRAYVLMQLKRYEEAVSACQQALYIYNQLRLEDQAAATHCELGQAYFRLDDFRAALGECEAGLAYWETEPDSADALACLKWRALALAALNRNDEALAALSESWNLFEQAGQPEELAELLPALERVLKALDREGEIKSYRERLRRARSANIAAGTPAGY